MPVSATCIYVESGIDVDTGTGRSYWYSNNADTGMILIILILLIDAGNDVDAVI